VKANDRRLMTAHVNKKNAEFEKCLQDIYNILSDRTQYFLSEFLSRKNSAQDSIIKEMIDLGVKSHHFKTVLKVSYSRYTRIKDGKEKLRPPGKTGKSINYVQMVPGWFALIGFYNRNKWIKKCQCSHNIRFNLFARPTRKMNLKSIFKDYISITTAKNLPHIHHYSTWVSWIRSDFRGKFKFTFRS
jgi:hypothetical protein